MEEFFNNFLSKPSVWLYLFIFFGKIIEVSVMTIRVVLINRGERAVGSIIAFFEVCIWIIVTGTVLAGFQKDLFRCVVFAAAFACGSYIGSWLESKLALGLSSLQVIAPEAEDTVSLIEELRSCEFAVTAIDGEGKEGKRELLVLHLKRKRIPAALGIIKKWLKHAVVTVNDVRVVHGGYIKK